MALEKIASTARWQAYSDESGTALVFKCNSGDFRIGVSNYGVAYISTNTGKLKLSPEATNRCGIEEEK